MTALFDFRWIKVSANNAPDDVMYTFTMSFSLIAELLFDSWYYAVCIILLGKGIFFPPSINRINLSSKLRSVNSLNCKPTVEKGFLCYLSSVFGDVRWIGFAISFYARLTNPRAMPDASA